LLFLSSGEWKWSFLEILALSGLAKDAQRKHGKVQTSGLLNAVFRAILLSGSYLKSDSWC